jgi:murein DD-endopeptidase MepM/ murein hydrolase activator NlpD
MKKKNILTALFAAVFLGIALIVLLTKNEPVSIDVAESPEDKLDIPQPSPPIFGIAIDTFEVIKAQVPPNGSFGQITGEAGLSTSAIFTIAEEVKPVFDVRKLRAGQDYTLLKGKNSVAPSIFIYEESLLNYYLVYLKDSVYAEARQRKSTIVQRHVTGTITSSLYETLQQKEVSTNLTMKLADIYAWTIDFFRIQKGDSITVVFEDMYVDDTIFAGTRNILAARFDHAGKPYYAFRFTNTEGQTNYYDEQGKGLKKAFLKAPLQFSRISSRYTMKRFHPVQKRWKAHLGTDYAAPTGTPIMTTADGTIEQAGYTSGNGNYVKVKHNSTYTTQYLHMSKIAKGIKRNVRVRQGDIIGYVGSTGLATGPHVCYRFWVNGKQVDPYSQKLPNSEPVPENYKAAYDSLVSKQMELLNNRP